MLKSSWMNLVIETPVILNPDQLTFPSPSLALDDGLLAIGGDLSCERLIQAYRQGIFPWFNQGEPILWWSPNPRAILFPNNLVVSHSLRKSLKKNYTVTMDKAFEQVVIACSQPRAKQQETWIGPEMISAYCQLHQRGFAHSLEVWLADKLIGGLYGIVLKRVFFGESMFHKVRDASKIALYHLCHHHQFDFIDCQLISPHLVSLGCKAIDRDAFLSLLKNALT